MSYLPELGWRSSGGTFDANPATSLLAVGVLAFLLVAVFTKGGRA